ncbi:TPA: MATE family efflux transporter [Clostridioides difficile]|nr:MATE family efflux transporter [Clostridioides difficile]HBG2782295.1 MATE family efflux transporter [Clostridioides difficile]
MENSNTNLGSESVGKLLFKLATPAIIAQIVNVLYNIVDRIFIGRMENGEVAMAGVGVAFPIIIIITACSYLIGMGGGPLAAIKMGEQNNDEAEKIMSNSFSVLVILAILLTIGFKIGKEPLLWMFGASESTIGYSMDYLNIYLIGTVFVQISMGMNTFINTQGFATTGMMTVAIGALINIILDPIFIFGFNMGVKGAALATIIAQGVSAIWVLMFLFGKKSILKIKKKYMIPKASIILPVLGLGISPFIMQSTESLVLIALNSKLQMYGGDLAVGSMAIMSSIMQILMLPNMGVTQGAQPIISYNYGSGQLDRVKKTFKLCLLSCFTYSTILWLLLMIFPAFFVSIFNKNPQLLSMTSWSIKIYFAGAFMFGIQIACQQTFLALRKIVLLIPLIFILPTFFNEKLFAVILAEPVADITAATITAISFFIFYKCFLSKPKAIKE